jgi:hypothetical protein
MQTCKVGLVAAEIAKTLAAPELATRENVIMLAKKLEMWRVEVPLKLQIPNLTSGNPSDLNLYQRRAILMVHVRSAQCHALTNTNVLSRSCILGL